MLLFCYLALAGTAGNVFSQNKPSTDGQDVVKLTSTVIAITADDQFYIGKEKVEQADIPEKVKQAFKDKPPDEQIVYIKAMCPVKYGVIVSVIEAVREAGFDSIGLVSDKRKGADKSPAPGTKSTAEGDGKIATVPEPVQRDNAPRPTPSETVLIEVESMALVRLNAEAMSLQGLRITLERLLNGRSNKTVFIKAPKDMIYCDVLKVIDIVKGAGARPIGLQAGNLK